MQNIRIDIDESNMVREAQIQAKQVRDVWEMCARLDYEHSRAKDNLRLITAKVAYEVRKDPTAHGLGKLTNDIVADFVTLDPRVVEAHEAVNRAKYNVDACGAIREALVDRKKMLVIMADLMIHDLYGQPNLNKAAAPAGIRPTEREKERE